MSDRVHTALEASAVGIGLRPAYYAEFIDGSPPVAWVEVHAENYFCRGGTADQILLTIAERYPVSLHGVGLSLGSADGVDGEHLERLASLVDDVQPCLVSEHLAWSRVDGIYYNDLLPLPLTEETLAIVAANVDRVQQRLGRALLVENPSAYLRVRFSTIDEAEFLGRLVAHTSCGLLLDVNNLFVSAHNVALDPVAYLGGLPAAAVGEIHLAGHEVSQRPGASLLIDTHAAPIADAVWRLFAHTIAWLGQRPTLIERDAALPPLAALLAEAEQASWHLTAPLGRCA